VSIERERQIQEQLGILRELIEAESRLRIEDKSEMTLLNLRLQRFMEEKGPKLAAVLHPRIELAHLSTDANSLDSLYVALEDRFRGSEQQIRDRLKVYIDPIRDADVVTDESPLLDVGSGRGEWLKVLRDESLPARGVELNPLLVMQSRSAGLSVDEGDAIEFLKQCRDQSLGAVTGLHIVEHLELNAVIRLIDESLRSLKPGGLLIFETPNPENVLVGSCNFYFDPTHRNPIPPPVLQFFLESRGFSDVRILRLNPSDDQPLEGDSELIQRFNRLFYGPMDYAVIGRKSNSSALA
jgi:O-antigen chain-terminating methyltransferase